MVCKEEVFLWFQNLKGSKRIEALCGFLNMCYPLELRFYGTCLEDLGRRDFYAIRDEEAKANNITEILKIRNIHDPYMRSKLIVVLSLLNSSNTLCAKELFKVLSEEVRIEILATLGILTDPKLVEHYLLLLTLAQHHPAFTFSEQNFLSNLSISLEKYAKDMNPRTKYECEESCLQSSVFPYIGSLPPTGMSERDVYISSPQAYRYFPPPLQRRASDCQQNPGRITSLKVKAPHRKQYIRIRVVWGNNKATDAFKTPKELLGFHQKLLEMFPAEAKMANQEKFIPPFPQSVVAASQLNNLNDSVISSVSEYIQQLNSRLPFYILENDLVMSFFMPLTHTRATLTKGNRCAENGQNDIPPRNPRLRSLTIYNSQMADNSPSHRSECRQKVTHSSVPRNLSENSCGRSSPLTSPLQSPSSSPYASPISSETNSRAASPWSHIAGPYAERSACSPHGDPAAVNKVLIKDKMPNQWEVPRNFKIEELQAMPIEELESLGILQDSSTENKILDIKSPPNGLINPYLSKSPNSSKPVLMHQPTSNNSSPACSEYSSPPQSPSPAEACNQSNSVSSSTEENVDKRNIIKTVPDLSKVDISNSPQIVHESNFKQTDDDLFSIKGSLNRTTISVLPFPAPYSSIISQMPPPQNMKPAYLPIPCRTNNVPQHMSPGAVVFDNQFSRVPLPSALTFLPGPPRPHTVTPDRVLSTSNPISTVSPFPVVTSGCATVPSATFCITTHKSSNITVVTNSSASSNRHTQKNPSIRDQDMVKPVQQPGEAQYAASGFMLSSTAQLTPASCSCFTSNSARPSPAPSPSMSPGTTPQPAAVPVSLPYIGMPYVFHHSIPFLHSQAPVNGYVPQPGIANPGQSFSYALPNGLTAIHPELMYPGQTFTLQSPTQGNHGQVASHVSQCYGAFPQTTAVPMKLISCYNCGKVGHRGSDCKEQTMDDLNKAGKFQLNYTPIPKIPDCRE